MNVMSSEESASALVGAAHLGELGLIGRLLNAGVEPNVQSMSEGRSSFPLSPLVMAASAGHQLAVTMLLRKGARVNDTCGPGLTALYQACTSGNHAIVAQLLEANASLDASTPDGATSMHMVSQAGHEQCVALLLSAGCALDVPLNSDKSKFPDSEQDEAGGAPLYIAAKNGRRRCVELLIEAKCNVHKKTSAGRTAMWMANKKGHKDVADLLRAAANPNDEKS